MSQEQQKTFCPQDYHSTFDPDAYLEHYFSKKAIEQGTRVSLFALPVFAHIIQQTVPAEKRQTLLDIGAGPTVYSALCFRDVVQRVYLTDYVEKNLDLLRVWMKGDSPYDWTPTIKVIRRTEGGGGSPTNDSYTEDEEKAKDLVRRGGIHFADVHCDPVVPDLAGRQSDILLTIFTLESACQNYDQYVKCVRNIVAQLRSGGKFIIGSVLEDDEYNSGKQLIFSLLHLTEEMILSALEMAGIDLSSAKKYVLPDEGVMFLMATKL